MSKSAATAGDRRVLAEAPSGEVVDLGDLSEKQRVVSADVIRRLCVGREAKDVDPRGIRIKNAHIVETLDLSFSTIAHPLSFEATPFDAIPDVIGAQLPALWLEDCALPGLRADRIRVYDLRLASSNVTGVVGLYGASIGGVLDCSGATLVNREGFALDSRHMTIGRLIFRNVSVTGG